MPYRIHLVAGARPNFMKVGPLYHVLRARTWAKPILVHTGQHYDPEMSEVFLRDLGLPPPDHVLHCRETGHAGQTAAVMVSYERLCLAEPPDFVVVVGDVNSTLAAALVAVKLGLPVGHLEAGLRSWDRTMPEEINRVVTDRIAHLLWTPSPDADDNLRREGVPEDALCRVGNIMIDAFERLRPRIAAAGTPARLGLAGRAYGVVTLHRPHNVDDPARLAALLAALARVATQLPLVFPLHPRTRRALAAAGLEPLLADARIQTVEPLGYVAFLGLVQAARLVITDSGGIQEETSYLGIPCLTLRQSTERPITLTLGTNRLVTPDQLSEAVAGVLAVPMPAVPVIPLWDGRTAERVADRLEVFLTVLPDLPKPTQR